jgi:hypothetical protein
MSSSASTVAASAAAAASSAPAPASAPFVPGAGLRIAERIGRLSDAELQRISNEVVAYASTLAISSQSPEYATPRTMPSQHGDAGFSSLIAA